MARYRIYPIRDNTLLENSKINTGLNGVMELWYGKEGITRHLVMFDTTEYMDKHYNQLVPHITATTATLHMISSYPSNDVTYSQPVETEYAHGVALEVNIVQQNWAEGQGLSFYGDNVITGNSNWYSATTYIPWGSYGGDYVTNVFTGHVENAYDNFSGDVTDAIALWDAFSGTNYGFIIKYTDVIEDLTGDTKTILKYYTHDTTLQLNVPYIQLDWDDQVTDERDEILPLTTKRLYFYSKKDGVLTNMNDVADVTIRYSEIGTADLVITGITNQLPGIYYVDFPCADVVGTFSDTWNVQFESGMTFTNVEQQGTILDESDPWANDLVDVIDPTAYVINIPNFRRVYKTGELVYLDVNAQIKYMSQIEVLKELEFRIYLVDGNTRTVVIDWSGVSYSNDDNFIRLDTSWLLVGNEYELSFRHATDSNTFISMTDRRFRVEA